MAGLLPGGAAKFLPRKLAWGATKRMGKAVWSSPIRKKINFPMVIGAGVGLAMVGNSIQKDVVRVASEATTGDPDALGNAINYKTMVEEPALAFAAFNPVMRTMAQGYDAMSHENIQAYYGGPSAPPDMNPLYEDMLAQQDAYSSARASWPSTNATGALVFGLYNNRLK